MMFTHECTRSFERHTEVNRAASGLSKQDKFVLLINESVAMSDMSNISELW